MVSTEIMSEAIAPISSCKPNKHGTHKRKLNANKTFHARTLTLQCDPAQLD